MDLFIKGKKVQGITTGVLRKYTLELERLSQFCERKGVYTVQGIARELLTDFCATWVTYYPSSYTRPKVRERCRSFLRYGYECRWLERIPPLPKIAVDEPPIMPLTPDEYNKLLDAVYLAIRAVGMARSHRKVSPPIRGLAFTLCFRSCAGAGLQSVMQ